MNKNEILQLSRMEMRHEAQRILDFNATNNKVTYSNFKERKQNHQTFVLHIIDILGSNIHKSPEYYQKIWKTFLKINEIVDTYNQNITHDQQWLEVYQKACKIFFKDEEYDSIEQKNIIKWYKTYRGMATGQFYQGDLENEHLKIRTIQHMMQETLLSYLNSDNAKEDWKIVTEQYKEALTNNMNSVH